MTVQGVRGGHPVSVDCGGFVVLALNVARSAAAQSFAPFMKKKLSCSTAVLHRVSEERIEFVYCCYMLSSVLSLQL